MLWNRWLCAWMICRGNLCLDTAFSSLSVSLTRLLMAVINHPLGLLAVFFSKDVFASSSAYGGRKNAALDLDIPAACLSMSYILCKTYAEPLWDTQPQTLKIIVYSVYTITISDLYLCIHYHNIIMANFILVKFLTSCKYYQNYMPLHLPNKTEYKIVTTVTDVLLKVLVYWVKVDKGCFF